MLLVLSICFINSFVSGFICYFLPPNKYPSPLSPFASHNFIGFYAAQHPLWVCQLYHESTQHVLIRFLRLTLSLFKIRTNTICGKICYVRVMNLFFKMAIIEWNSRDGTFRRTPRMIMWFWLLVFFHLLPFEIIHQPSTSNC